MLRAIDAYTGSSACHPGLFPMSHSLSAAASDSTKRNDARQVQATLFDRAEIAVVSRRLMPLAWDVRAVDCAVGPVGSLSGRPFSSAESRSGFWRARVGPGKLIGTQ